MGRKSSKVRQLDGLGLDFSDMFGDDGSDKPPKAENPKAKSAEPKSKAKVKEQPPAPEVTKPESTTRDLEQWLKQDEDFKQLQAEMETLKAKHEAERAEWVKERETLEAQQDAEKKRLEAEAAPLKETVDRLEKELLESKQQLASEQEHLRVAKDEIERQKDAMEKAKQAQLDASDVILLTTLLNERGLRTHGEYTSFYQAVGTSPHSWNVFKDATVPKESTRAFLAEQVHLVCSSIRDTSSIHGVCVPVDNDKCELSGGVSLRDEMRELVTEILLQGWNKLLILGMAKTYVNFVRHHLSKTTIEVQVDAREGQWSYSPDMRNYPVILVFGGGSERIPQNCPSQVFCYDTTVFGQGIQQCRKALGGLSED